jgi:hypothetical protein
MNLPVAPAAAVAILAIAAAGSTDRCRASLADPDPPEQGTPELEFTVVSGDDGGQLRADSVAAGQVVIKGGLRTPNPCYTLEAELEPDQSGLTVGVVATAQPVVCIQTLGMFAYRARIHGLAAGHYRVAITVTYPGTGWEPRADTLQVDVP